MFLKQIQEILKLKHPVSCEVVHVRLEKKLEQLGRTRFLSFLQQAYCWETKWRWKGWNVPCKPQWLSPFISALEVGVRPAHRDRTARQSKTGVTWEMLLLRVVGLATRQNLQGLAVWGQDSN